MEGDCEVSLHSFESTTSWYICQMRSSPAVNRIRRVGSVTYARCVPGHAADRVPLDRLVDKAGNTMKRVCAVSGY